MNARRIALSLLLAAFAPLVAQGAEEWKELFNGKNLEGWTIVRDRDNWTVSHGELHAAPGMGWLSTNEEYANFELELEFKVAKGANSGVFLRAPREGDPAYTGMEVQILDDDDPQYAKIEKFQYCGSLYRISAPKAKANKKFGEWQKYRIVCDGPKVNIKLNDVEVVDVNLNDHLDKAKKVGGVTRKSGYIGLQYHGTAVEFRNVRIRKLP